MAEQVYLGLGGNIGDTEAVIRAVVKDIAALTGTSRTILSRLYCTTPVEVVDAEQPFVNAACLIETNTALGNLISQLQAIEQKYGKAEKPKQSSRIIDIDILFYGKFQGVVDTVVIPHPRWQERLFVLQPLFDLTESIAMQGELINLAPLLEEFTNLHNEIVIPITESNYETCIC